MKKIYTKKIKRILCLFMALMICSTFCAPTVLKAAETPEWVKEGEEWFLANPLLREGADSCKYGHTKPSGYTYQGYTSGYCTSTYAPIADTLTLISYMSGNPIVVKVASLGSFVANWLRANETITIKYFKYVYSNGNNYWNHIIYVDQSTGHYVQISCETYYGL